MHTGFLKLLFATALVLAYMAAVYGFAVPLLISAASTELALVGAALALFGLWPLLLLLKNFFRALRGNTTPGN